MRVLITGGAGYVGSHACKALSASGFEPVAFDDLRRGNRWAVRWGPLIERDLAERSSISDAIREHSVEAVMHFAAYAYVGESMENPALYFRNNVVNSLNLLDAMVETGVRHIVVSSSCAVYGAPDEVPITERTPLRPINPYGESKAMLERLLSWYGHCHDLSWTALRYFNAAGADPDSEIGEWHDPEPHLIPIVIEAALGMRPHVSIYGTDYDTPDGTAVRDYVHVSDLADAHVLALECLLGGGESSALNLGTGCGASVREIIEAVARVAAHRPNVLEGPRRQGDPHTLVADPSLAREKLGWTPTLSDLDVIARTALDWREKGLAKVLRDG
ncbi:MAG: UDP-glucose 4-epimerase GalE [Proteobacteria bacterium]|nr:UDP-glucose 4-epimerase GalE [Pseudomonadota bacterium]